MSSLAVIGDLALAADHDWQQRGVDIDGRSAGDRLGTSTAMSADGQTIIVGSPGNGAGYAQVFADDGSGWVQMGSDLVGEASGDRFGIASAMSADGSIVAVGAIGNDGSGTDSGHVRVYEYDGGRWLRLGDDIDGEAAGDRSGGALAISADGSRVAIGAADNNGGATEAGHVRVYEFDDSLGLWAQLGDDIDGGRPFFGFGRAVAMSGDGNTVVTSAPRVDAGDGDVEGFLVVHDYVDGRWASRATISGEDLTAFGTEIAISADGTTVAANSSTFPEYVRVHRHDGSRWVQVGSDIPRLFSDRLVDRFGSSLALSADGLTLAAGSTRFSADIPGYARVYTFAGSEWASVGSVIFREASDTYGGPSSLSMNADGTSVVLGASNNSDNGTDSGHARVFELPSSMGDLCAGAVVTIDMRTNGGVGFGTSGDDVIMGTRDADEIWGRGGNDTICGGGGDDIIRGGSGDDVVRGGGGDDEITAGFGDDTVNGGAGNDTIFGKVGNDRLNGGPGADVVLGGPGDDRIFGGPGSDSLNGGGGQDRLAGERGEDTLRGGGGDDTLIGGPDADACNGGGGSDSSSECERNVGIP